MQSQQHRIKMCEWAQIEIAGKVKGGKHALQVSTCSSDFGEIEPKRSAGTNRSDHCYLHAGSQRSIASFCGAGQC